MVLLETSSKLDHPALLPTSDGVQESQFHLLLFKFKVYQNVLVVLDHQDTVSHTLLVTRPSLQVPMVLPVTNLFQEQPASHLTLDGDQESQYQVKCQKILPLFCKTDTMPQLITFQ